MPYADPDPSITPEQRYLQQYHGFTPSLGHEAEPPTSGATLSPEQLDYFNQGKPQASGTLSPAELAYRNLSSQGATITNPYLRAAGQKLEAEPWRAHGFSSNPFQKDLGGLGGWQRAAYALPEAAKTDQYSRDLANWMRSPISRGLSPELQQAARATMMSRAGIAPLRPEWSNITPKFQEAMTPEEVQRLGHKASTRREGRTRKGVSQVAAGVIGGFPAIAGSLASSLAGKMSGNQTLAQVVGLIAALASGGAGAGGGLGQYAGGAAGRAVGGGLVGQAASGAVSGALQAAPGMVATGKFDPYAFATGAGLGALAPGLRGAGLPGWATSGAQTLAGAGARAARGGKIDPRAEALQALLGAYQGYRQEGK